MDYQVINPPKTNHFKEITDHSQLILFLLTTESKGGVFIFIALQQTIPKITLPNWSWYRYLNLPEALARDPEARVKNSLNLRYFPLKL